MVKAGVPRESTRPRIRSAIASVLRNAPSTYPGDDRKVSAAKLGHGAMRVLAAAIVLALAAVVGRQAVAAEPPLAAPTLVGPPEIVFASTKDACDVTTFRTRRCGRFATRRARSCSSGCITRTARSAVKASTS